MKIKQWCALALVYAAAFASAPDPELSVAPPGMIFELLSLNKDLATTARPKYLSPCDLVASPDSTKLYVAEQTAKQIAVVDLTTKAVVRTIKLPNEPTGIAVASKGFLYVSCSSDWWPNGMVCEVDPGSAKVLRRLPAGHGARSPVVSPVENTLFVCNTYDNDISVVDIAGAKETKRIKTVRQPCCAAITPDGATLAVGNSMPGQLSTDTLKLASTITLINAYSREKIVDLALPTGSHNVSGVTISADGKYAFVTHLIGNFSIPATKVEQGWIHTNNCAIVDLKNYKIKNDITLDRPLQGSGNPWGVACTRDGTTLCVAHSGSNELSIIGMKQLITIADTTPFVSSVLTALMRAPLCHDLSALRYGLEKATVSGVSPRALAVIGSQAFIAGYFSDSVEIFDLAPPDTVAYYTMPPLTAAGIISLGASVRKTSERMGEIAFHDASLCFQKWESCHTCHPFTRAAGLNWTLRNEIAAPKNSTSMLYSWWTPPTSWSGGRSGAYESIRAGMNNELFLEPDMAIARNMDTFFMKMKPVPSPRLVKGRLSASAMRGRELYNSSKAACMSCHPGPLYTDLKLHNGGITDPYDNNTKWDTPTLVECWRTAPYGHLGSKLTIQDILALPGMGAVTSKLTQDELNDLVEFVLSL
jgi:YVTN family beta-propeller protein